MSLRDLSRLPYQTQYCSFVCTSDETIPAPSIKIPIPIPFYVSLSFRAGIDQFQYRFRARPIPIPILLKNQYTEKISVLNSLFNSDSDSIGLETVLIPIFCFVHNGVS